MMQVQANLSTKATLGTKFTGDCGEVEQISRLGREYVAVVGRWPLVQVRSNFIRNCRIFSAILQHSQRTIYFGPRCSKGR